MKNNYIYKQNFVIKDPNRVIFLCGTKFQDNSDDKRIVLKSYIETRKTNDKVIILEEHFIFGRPRKDYLSYDSIFLKNLKDIELLTALYSDKILIIHESISTAAELGLFAGNNSVQEKTCIMTPYSFSVEEEKISSFIRLAFFRDKDQKRFRRITFYPRVKENIVSKSKSDYHTFFPQNKVQKALALKIDNFIEDNYQDNLYIKFVQSRYNKKLTDQNIVTYAVTNNKLNVYIYPRILRVFYLTLFNITELRTELSKCTSILTAVDILSKYLKQVICNSISQYEAEDYSNYDLNILISDSTIRFRDATGYFLYLLQALGMIKLPNGEDHHVIFTHKFKPMYNLYSNAIKEIKPSKIHDIL